MSSTNIGVDSPFFSTIVLFKHQLVACVFDGFLKRRIPGKNGEGSPRTKGEVALGGSASMRLPIGALSMARLPAW